MKPPSCHPVSRRRFPLARQAAFTLPELMVSIALFLMLVAGVLSSHLCGLRLSGITEAKLRASTAAREALGRLSGEIRGCTSAWVGNIKDGVFAEIPSGKPQVGAALLVQPGTNAAQYIVYFVNPEDHSFRRTTSDEGTPMILARSVTNDMVFAAQDFAGNVLTTSLNNRVIHIRLEFYQPQPFRIDADYFKIETAVTRRTMD